MTSELTLEKFEEAAERVKEVTLETRLVYSEYFSSQTGNKVYFKPENLQYTGAYKVRGAYYKISTLSEEERNKGLITASAGNHAQGVAYAAKCYGSKATITNAVKYLQNQGKTVIGGTNADFFVMSSGVPIGLVIDKGTLISSDAWQYAVGFKKDGTAVIGRPTMGIRILSLIHI